MSKKRKPKHAMDLVMTIIAIVLIVFTTVMVITYWKIGGVPDVLITAVFGACLGEFGFMAWIKNVKEKFSGGENYADNDCITDYFSDDDDTCHRSN